jgi:hypothetical protein
MRLLCGTAHGRCEGLWWPIERLDDAGLPTLFARLVERGRAWREAA